MRKESKAILGQWIRGKLYFSDNEKMIIIQSYLSGNATKQSVYEHYTGYSSEHGKITKWMRQLGIADKIEKNTNLVNMAKCKKNIGDVSSESETLQLKQRIEELEKQLERAELKAIAFSTMVDIAEKEFKVPIRKKYNTKL